MDSKESNNLSQNIKDYPKREIIAECKSIGNFLGFVYESSYSRRETCDSDLITECYRQMKRNLWMNGWNPNKCEIDIIDPY